MPDLYETLLFQSLARPRLQAEQEREAWGQAAQSAGRGLEQMNAERDARLAQEQEFAKRQAFLAAQLGEPAPTPSDERVAQFARMGALEERAVMQEVVRKAQEARAMEELQAGLTGARDLQQEQWRQGAATAEAERREAGAERAHGYRLGEIRAGLAGQAQRAAGKMTEEDRTVDQLLRLHRNVIQEAAKFSAHGVKMPGYEEAISRAREIEGLLALMGRAPPQWKIEDLGEGEESPGASEIVLPPGKQPPSPKKKAAEVGDVTVDDLK